MLPESILCNIQPIYYAIRNHCSLSLIQTLFDTNPNAIFERDFCGDVPLYMLFRPKIDSRILEHVLNTNPSLAFFEEERFSGTKSLLQSICAQWKNVVRKQTATSSMSLDSLSSSSHNDGSEIILTRGTIYSDSALLDRWNKLVLTARAAHCVAHKRRASSTVNEARAAISSHLDASERSTPELHIALQLESLPLAVICQFIEMYPEQASMEFSNASIQTNHHQIYSEESADRTYIEEKGTKPMLKEPVATSPPGGSRSLRRTPTQLPLHAAIAKMSLSWEEGLRQLVYAYPAALGARDGLDTRMVPFSQQTAIAAARSSAYLDCDGKKSLTTAYCLLREDPSVLSRMVASPSRL